MHWKCDRRQFLHDSGLFVGWIACNAQKNPIASALLLRDANNSSAKDLAPRFNPNLQTAIGLGDQTPGIVDQYGQLDSRNALVFLKIGSTALESPESARP